MFSRKKNEAMYGDPTTGRLVNNGLYSFNGPEMRDESRFSGLLTNNIFVGIWYVFILSCLLWWMPLFGPMIAGYLGGRKAGSPMKGIMVAIIPVFIILLFMIGMDAGAFPFLVGIAGVPGAIMSGVRSLSPHAASYLSGMYTSLGAAAGFNGNGLFIIVIFGYIGGMMADMNRQEFERATGSGHFYDAFLGKLSPGNIGKFADMVAERVMWSLGAIGHSGGNLLARNHAGTSVSGFEDLKKLPASSAQFQDYEQDPAYQPVDAFGYEDAGPYQEDIGYDDYVERDLISYDVPDSSDMMPADEEWGVSHCDLSEDSMLDSWKEHNKKMDKKKKYRRDTKKQAAKLSSKVTKASNKNKPKRDALVIEDKVKPIKKESSKGKSEFASLKKKRPSIVTRALEADKEIKEKEDVKEEPIIDDPMEEIDRKPVKPRAVQSYDRL
jgi:hypothetical protein